MEFIYENGNKYVNLYEVAEFLNYKRINSFISKIVGISKTKIKEFYVESRELVLLLFNNKRENIKPLLELLLTDSQQEEIDEVVDKFNICTNNEYLWIKNSKVNTMIKNLWYIISSKNYGILKSCDKYLALYNISESEAIDLIDINLTIHVYITKEQRILMDLE